MIINENSILYFSGTGNTYDVSSKLAEKSGFKLLSVSELAQEERVEIDCEVIGLAFPIYYGGVPNIISRIIDRIKSAEVKYIFALATYGGMPGNPFKILENKLRTRDLRLGAVFLINMPDNYIPVIGARSKKVQKKNFEKADKKIEEINNIIACRKVIPYQKVHI